MPPPGGHAADVGCGPQSSMLGQILLKCADGGPILVDLAPKMKHVWSTSANNLAQSGRFWPMLAEFGGKLDKTDFDSAGFGQGWPSLVEAGPKFGRPRAKTFHEFDGSPPKLATSWPGFDHALSLADLGPVLEEIDPHPQRLRGCRSGTIDHAPM